MFINFTHSNIIIDDFGNELFILSSDSNNFSSTHKIKGNKYLTTENAMVVGSTISCVKSQYLIHKEDLGAHKLSVKLFHESEQNCNTCKHLVRLKHPKDSNGFLHGTCINTVCRNTLYQSTKEHMIFHPEDPMHMECYTPRWIS